jgi:hypothetical protein
VKLRRGSRLPDEARASLPLEPGERVIAEARTGANTWVAATGTALVRPEGRTAWADVAHAQWYADEDVLAVDPVPGAGPAVRLHLVDPGRLPETVRERVVASIVLSRRVALPGGGGVRLVARRGGGSDEVVWQRVPDEGTDLADPAVRAVVDAALDRMRGELGH